MRLAVPIACAALIAATAASAADPAEPAPAAWATATATVSLSTEPAGPIPEPPGAFGGRHWEGVSSRCADLGGARRLFAELRRARPANAEAAYPLLTAAAARHGCAETDTDPDWTDIPREFEFADDGQGLQLMTARDAHGRRIGVVYRRGAC